MANGTTNTASRKMAKLVVAEKRDNGSYGFRQKIVPLDDVKEELEAAKDENCRTPRPTQDPRTSGAWRSPVAHLLWEQEVAGSSPAAPTIPVVGRLEGKRLEGFGYYARCILQTFNLRTFNRQVCARSSVG